MQTHFHEMARHKRFFVYVCVVCSKCSLALLLFFFGTFRFGFLICVWH